MQWQGQGLAFADKLQLGPINTGKIMKNAENIQSFQMEAVLANQVWEKNFYFTKILVTIISNCIFRKYNNYF